MKYLRKARRAAKKIKVEYEISDAGGLELLETFISAYALELRAEAQIEAEGLTYYDRFNQVKSHPLLATVRDARSQKLAALKALNLDIEPLQNRPGRPEG
jgi:phage terminase small subunit